MLVSACRPGRLPIDIARNENPRSKNRALVEFLLRNACLYVCLQFGSTAGLVQCCSTPPSLLRRSMQSARRAREVSNSRPNRSSEHRKCTLRGMKINPQRVQNQPRSPRGGAGAPKSVQAPSKSASRAPKIAPRAPQECPMASQERSKSAPRAPK